jgi:hypothetical protein
MREDPRAAAVDDADHHAGCALLDIDPLREQRADRVVVERKVGRSGGRGGRDQHACHHVSCARVHCIAADRIASKGSRARPVRRTRRAGGCAASRRIRVPSGGDRAGRWSPSPAAPADPACWRCRRARHAAVAAAPGDRARRACRPARSSPGAAGRRRRAPSASAVRRRAGAPRRCRARRRRPAHRAARAPAPRSDRRSVKARCRRRLGARCGAGSARAAACARPGRPLPAAPDGLPVPRCGVRCGRSGISSLSLITFIR